LNTGPQLIQKHSHLLKFNIAAAWTKFKNAFYLRNRNFDFSYLAGNPLLVNNRREKLPLNTSKVFNGVAEPAQVAKIKINDFFVNNGDFAGHDEVATSLEMNLPEQKYRILRTAILDSRLMQKNKTFLTEGSPDQSLDDFVNNFKKRVKTF
jgi:hypothetical protein